MGGGANTVYEWMVRKKHCVHYSVYIINTGCIKEGWGGGAIAPSLHP